MFERLIASGFEIQFHSHAAAILSAGFPEVAANLQATLLQATIPIKVDHIARFDAGVLALEIEWNNKDAFFDRDLENDKRLHADGAISAGILITRGASLQDAMRSMVHRFAAENEINAPEDLHRIGLNPARRQLIEYERRHRGETSFALAWASAFPSLASDDPPGGLRKPQSHARESNSVTLARPRTAPASESYTRRFGTRRCPGCAGAAGWWS
jgi:hypothetical protein